MTPQQHAALLALRKPRPPLVPNDMYRRLIHDMTYGDLNRWLNQWRNYDARAGS